MLFGLTPEQEQLKAYMQQLEEEGLIPNPIPVPFARAIIINSNIDFSDLNGITALRLLVDKGDLKRVKEIVEQYGASALQKDNFGQTLLHTSALLGHTDIVKYLFQQPDIDLMARDYTGQLALYNAINNDREDIIKLFMEQKQAPQMLANKDIFGNTPLNLAIIKGNDKIIQLLDPTIKDPSKLKGYKEEQINISQQNLNKKLEAYILKKRRSDPKEVLDENGVCNGWTFLKQIYATQNKDNDFFELLTLIATWDEDPDSLENTNLPNSVKAHFGNVKLEWVFEQLIHQLVAFQGEFETEAKSQEQVKILNIDFQTQRLQQHNQMKTSNRILQPMFQHSLMVIPKEDRQAKGFWAKCDVQTREQINERLSIYSRFPMMCVDIALQISSTAHLLGFTIAPDGSFNFYDSNVAQKMENFKTAEEMINFLIGAYNLNPQKITIGYNCYKIYDNPQQIPDIEIAHPGAHIDPSPNKWNALHYAVLENNLVLIEQLISNDQQLILAQDAFGKTPFDIALESKNHKVLSLLLKSPLRNQLFTFDFNAVWISVFEFIVETVIRENLDINMQDKEGRSILYAAISQELNVNLIKEILRKNPSLELGRGGDTPLELAIRMYRPDIVKLLLDKGSEITPAAMETAEQDYHYKPILKILEETIKAREILSKPLQRSYSVSYPEKENRQPKKQPEPESPSPKKPPTQKRRGSV